MKNIYKIHYIVFFLALFFSKAMAEPTFVRSVSIENVSGYTVNGLNFNNDGSKMYLQFLGRTKFMMNNYL